MVNFSEHKATISVREYLDKYYDFNATGARCMKCQNYGKRWFCPPYDYDTVEEVWSNYKELDVICVKVNTEGLTNDEAIPLFFEGRQYLDDKLYALENDTEGSLALCAGFCYRCEKCARLEGKPCIMPDKGRYSIESIGGLVTETVKGLFGFDMLWGSEGMAPEYYLLTGGLLRR